MQSQIKPSQSETTFDEEAIRKLYRLLLESWNQRDASKMAGLFSPDGHVIGFDGSPVDGRAAIEAEMGKIFADHPTAAYVGIVREVRFLAPDVALLRSAAGMVPPGKSEINPAVNAIQSLVAVRQGARWSIALYQNTPAQFHGRPELVQQMTEELTKELHG